MQETALKAFLANNIMNILNIIIDYNANEE